MKTKQKLLAALKVWLVIYPSITFFLFLFGQALSEFPLFLRTLILTLALVPWMIFIGMPLLEAIFQLIGEKNKKG